MNTLLNKIDLIINRANQLNCIVVDILDNVVLCKRGDDTFITWKVYYFDNKISFDSGHYDMTEQSGKNSLIERSTYKQGK